MAASDAGDDGQIADLHRAAQAALQQGRPREAHRLCLRILRRDRHHADAWFLCAVIAAGNRQHGQALRILDSALAIAPDKAEYLAERAKQLLALRRPREALAAAGTALAALSTPPVQRSVLNTLGGVFSHCGEHATALQCFQRATAGLSQERAQAGEPSARFHAELYLNLALSLQFAARFAAAEKAFEQAIALRPAFFKAHSALATLPPHATRGSSPERLKRLEGLQSQAATATDRLHLGHAIARELELQGRPEAALRTLTEAKRGRAAEVGYRAQRDRALFAAVREQFSAGFFAAGDAAGCDSDEPIFIVGMPRTGTTLVEQILGSHSRVFAAGELQNFPQQVSRLAANDSPQLLDADTLSAAARVNPRQLGADYVASTRPRTGHCAHFIDKLPLNFFYLGLIRRALPRARLICLRRDPMDTCLGNYRQLFATGYSHYHYNYELLDCGRYFIEFDRLMRHWRQVLPGAVLELEYEALVADPRAVTAQLLDWCQLPWEEDCLHFHRRRDSVATPSAAQVRQGIYRDAVGRWRQYGAALEPLRQLLQDAGCYPPDAG